ncbi:pentatricopeptide repeat-containing protein [Canna indica]|uniref:Pentatricopeptide repeat-containing protein n=1 Tax=Canna indica TaxID=4628 RepID=A0AAQ3KAL8_9LILI|nr:pentatricopeptide repeat-containing protein [Canna indica]
MLASLFRFIVKIPPLTLQPRRFISQSRLPKTPSLPPSPSLESQVIFDAICINLRRRKWKFLQQVSPHLTGPLVRRVILCFRSSPQLALEFFNWTSQQQRFSVDLDTHMVLVHVLVSGRLFDEALCIMRKLMGDGAVPVLELLDSMARTRKRYNGCRDAYDALVRSCTQIGTGEDACLVIETLRARGVWVSIHACNNLLNHLLMSSPDAGAAFWNMYKEILAVGYVENVNTFNLVIYGLCRESKIQEAFSVLYRMLKGRIFPNIATFNILIDGCCRNDVVNLGYDLFKKIKLVSGNTIKPNVVTFNCLINGLCKAGKVEDGEKLMKDMLETKILPNVQTYASLVDGYGREGKPEEALRLLIEMLDYGIVPNIVVYNSLLNWLFKQGYVEEACFLLSDMKKVHASPDHYTYAILVNGYCRNGNVQEAIRYYIQSIKEKLLKDIIPYNSLISYLFKQGSIYEVKQLLGRMFGSGLTPDVVTYSIFIDRLFKNRNIDDALEVYDEMVKEGQWPNLITYNSIIHGFCRMELLDVALLVIEELRRTGMLLDVFTYNTMINGYLSNHRVDEAFHICHDMQRVGIAVNEVTCNIFMDYLCRIGCFEQAKDLLRIMLDRLFIPDHITYTILITAFSKNCSANEVIELHDYMVIRGVSPDDFTYKTIVSILILAEEAQPCPALI